MIVVMVIDENDAIISFVDVILNIDARGGVVAAIVMIV